MADATLTVVDGRAVIQPFGAAFLSPLIDQAAASAELAEAWAEGTEPGGPGTKSAKAWAEEAGARVLTAVPFLSWADLAAATGMADGDRATVVAADTDTHVDPVTAATVANAGVYQYDDGAPGWERVADLDSALSSSSADNANESRLAVEKKRNAPPPLPVRLDSRINAVRHQFGRLDGFLDAGRYEYYANATISNAKDAKFKSSFITNDSKKAPFPPDLTSTGGAFKNTRRTVYPVFNQDAYDELAQRNVIQFDDPAGTATFKAQVFIPPEDFAAAGIDHAGEFSGAPWAGATFGMELSIVDGSAVNLNTGSMQFNFYLLYRDGTQDVHLNLGAITTETVLMRGGEGDNSAFYLGATNGWVNDEVALVSDWRTGYAMNGIPAAATIAGHAGKTFMGAVLEISCPVTTSGQPSSIQIARAVVAQNEVLPTQSYRNDPDDDLPDNYGEFTQTLRDADRVFFFGDSITAGYYAHRGKNFIQLVSQWLDYNCEGYGWSGGSAIDGIFQLANEYPSGNDIYYRQLTLPTGVKLGEATQPRDYPSTFAFIFFGENDRAVVTKPELRASLALALQHVKARGMVPILCSAWRAFEDDPVIRELADAAGVLFLSIHRWIRQFVRFTNDASDRYGEPKLGTADKQLFWVSHPGTRAANALADPMIRGLKALPRPNASLKVYRLRASVAPGAISELLVADPYQRNKLWREINLAQWQKANIPTQYDTLGGSLGGDEFYASEYNWMMDGTEVQFGQYTLVEAILPTTRVDAVSLNWPIAPRIGAVGTVYPAQDLQVYVRHLGALPVSQGRYNYRARFFMAADPVITAGATYTASTASGTFTFVSYDAARGEALFTYSTDPGTINKLTGAFPKAAGTLTLTGGTGPATVAYTKAGRAYDASFYSQTNRSEAKAIGKWVACTTDGDGNYSMPIDAVPENTAALGYSRTILDYDKVQFLIVAPAGETGFLSAGPPEINWRGFKGKAPQAIPAALPQFAAPTGTELLTDTHLCDATTLNAGWTANGGAAPAAATIGYVPRFDAVPSTGAYAVIVDAAKSVQQSFTYTPAALDDTLVTVRVLAGNFPALNSPGGGVGVLSSDTFDYRTVRIRIAVGNFTYEAIRRVSAWWGEATFEMSLPSIADAVGGSPIAATLTVDGPDGEIELAGVSIEKL